MTRRLRYLGVYQARGWTNDLGSAADIRAILAHAIRSPPAGACHEVLLSFRLGWARLNYIRRIRKSLNLPRIQRQAREALGLEPRARSRHGGCCRISDARHVIFPPHVDPTRSLYTINDIYWLAGPGTSLVNPYRRAVDMRLKVIRWVSMSRGELLCNMSRVAGLGVPPETCGQGS